MLASSLDTGCIGRNCLSLHKILDPLASARYHFNFGPRLAYVIGCIGAVYRVWADPYKYKFPD